MNSIQVIMRQREFAQAGSGPSQHDRAGPKQQIPLVLQTRQHSNILCFKQQKHSTDSLQPGLSVHDRVARALPVRARA